MRAPLLTLFPSIFSLSAPLTVEARMVPIGALYEQLTKALVKIGIFIVYFLPFFHTPCENAGFATDTS